jgi:DNA polymerase III subunit delta'
MAKRKSPETKVSEGQETNGGSGAHHPRLTQELFGHSSAEETFLRAFSSGALHHAWLLTGEPGIGKATFAYRAARFLLSRPVDQPSTPAEGGTLAISAKHPVARQIAAGAHPSLFVLASEGNSASIGVEAVRRLRSFLSLTTPGAWRAMIVDPANDLTAASANALLKAIEEPPPRTVFFLISHGAADVMPTIRSRCVKLILRPLNYSDFECALSGALISAELPEPDETTLRKLHAGSASSPGRALDLIAGGLLPLADKLDIIMARLSRMDHALVHELIQSTSGARNAETFSRLCNLIEERIEEMATREALEGARRSTSAAAWADLWQRVRERRLEMETLNLDKGSFLMAAFSDMEHVARKLSLASPA